VSKQEARTAVHFEFGGEIIGADGRRVSFPIDGSLRSWWAIVRWNIRGRHWQAVKLNLRDLLKLLRGKLWRRSS